MPYTVLEVWVQPNIKSVKDLVGKTISSTNPNSLGDLMIGVWLAKSGIKKSEVNVVYLGGLGNLVSAMKANKTEATLILPPLGFRFHRRPERLRQDDFALRHRWAFADQSG